MPITARCELAFEDPGTPAEWIDVSEFLRGFSYTRGRNTEQDRMEAGTASILLDNRDRRFDPTNGSSPYSPDVVPMRRVRLSADTDSGFDSFTMRSSTVRGGDVLRGEFLSFALFQGYVEEWPQAWNVGDATVEIHATDQFKLLSLATFIWAARYTGSDTFVAGLPGGTNVTPATGTPHPPDELTGARINRVLDTYGWPADERDIDEGVARVLGSDVSLGGNTNIIVNGTALDHINACAAIEGGDVFVSGAGKVTFRSPFTPDTADVFGDTSGELRYLDIVAEFDDARLWNRVSVSVSPALAASATVEDTASITRYGSPAGSEGSDAARVLTLSFIPTDSSTLDARRDEALARYSEPKLRITSLVPKLDTVTAILTVLGKELLDGVTVRKRPPAGGLIEQASRIERITVSSEDRYRWRWAWTVSEV